MRPEDAFFLYTQTSTVAQQVGGIAILADTSLGFPEVRAHVERRLRDLPTLRRRLGPPRRRWGRPTWITDGSLDLAHHLRERTVGAGGEPQSFAELLDDFFSTPVGTDRPPWEMHYVRGVSAGRAALVVKLHHAMGDGFAAIDTLSGLLDDARGRVVPAATPTPRAPRRTLPARRVRLLAAWLRGAAVVVSGLWNLGRAGQAPQCGLNGPIRTPRRHIASRSLSAGEVRDVARRLEARTTELLLTVVADAVGRLLAARGEPARWLLAMVPRSMRTQRTRSAPGNWTGGARIDLPVDALPPVVRLRETQQRLRRALRYGEPQASRFLMRAMGALPGPMQRRVARWTYRSRWFNVIVSVIPGPRRPVSFAGVPLQEVYPVLPLAEEVGLAVGVLSWGEAITVGVTADASLVPDAERLADEMVTSVESLRRATTPT